jgi:exopolysaccharide production protein ExoQ
LACDRRSSKTSVKSGKPTLPDRMTERPMKRLEWLFHVFVFALQCGGIIPMFLRTGDNLSDLGTANPLNTYATAFVLAITLVLLLRNAGPTFRYIPRMLPILALTSLAVLSISWSDYPDVTLRRSASLVTATLWAWYLAARYDLKDVVALIRQAIGVTALASLVVAVGAPAIGGEDPIGPAGWRGIFATKNDLGIAMAIGSVTYFYTLVAGRQKFSAIMLQILGLLLCLGLLRLAQSSTSLVITLVGIVLCLVVKLTHKRVGVAIIIWTAILLLLAPAVIIVTNQLGAIAPLLGRDAQLTGRVDLWLILPSYIAERPWLGHGLGAFWVADSANVSLIWDTVGWTPPHAHDGWLDVLLELGVVGLAFLCLQIILTVVNGVRAVVDGTEPNSQYVLVTTFILLAYNIAESNLVRPGVWWILLVIGATALAKIAKPRAPATRGFRFQRRAPLGSPYPGR